MVRALDKAFIEEELKIDVSGTRTNFMRSSTTIELGSSASDSLLSSISNGRSTSSVSTSSDQDGRDKKRKKKSKTPYLTEFGISIENFFKLECSLIGMFAVLSILAALQMIVFAAYNSNAKFNKSVMDRLTFASLGQASSVCSKCPAIYSDTHVQFLFQCSQNYHISEVFSSGIIGLDPLDHDINFDDKLWTA